MAQAFPARRSSAPTLTRRSIDVARERAAEAGVGDRIGFEVGRRRPRSPAPATTWSRPSTPCTTWATRSGAARRVHDALADDGTWMVVEPAAGDRVEDNLNPVGRAYYGFSTLLCTPASLSQDVGLAIGTQAGPARIRDIVTAAGFTRFRIAAQTPFNNVLGGAVP